MTADTSAERDELAAAWHARDCGCGDFTPGDEDETYQQWADWLLSSEWIAEHDRRVAHEALTSRHLISGEFWAVTMARVRREATAEALRPLQDLFALRPDTSCATTWREEPNIKGEPPYRIECVEVPMDELRAAFRKAGLTDG